MSLPWNPLYLLNPKTLWAATKLEWLFALFCIVLPLLSTLPPGSLEIVVKEIPARPFEMMVLSVDLTARPDNGTFQATMHPALFYRGVTKEGER